MEEQGSNMDNNGKAGTIKLAGKVALVALIFAVVFYLIYFTTQYGKANFILSSHEITSGDEAQVARYAVQDKVYFFINRKFEDLDSNMFAIEIEYFENNGLAVLKAVGYPARFVLGFVLDRDGYIDSITVVGESGSFGYAINDTGQVAGCSWTPDSTLHAVLWSSTGAPPGVLLS